MWKPIINQNEEIFRVQQKLKQIYADIVRYPMTEQYGLMSGYASILLFLFHYQQFTGRKEHEELFFQKFSDFYQNFTKTLYPSFSAGFAGIGWLLRYFHKKGVFDVDNIDDILSDIDLFTMGFLNYHSKNSSFDYLHEGLGEAYYFATTDNHKFDSALNIFFQHLNANKEVIATETNCWAKETYVNNTTIGRVYNMSLSHGMAAIMPCCIKYLQHRDSELVRNILIGTMNYFKMNALDDSHSSVFPKWIDPDTYAAHESPLSWCYGDPGMAQALFQAGEFIGDSDVVDLALKALLKASLRRDVNKEYIKEACFCHGSSSLLHIFNRMYQKTQLSAFKEAAIFWLEDTLSKGQYSSEFAGYQFYDNGDPNSNISLLAGLSGVGLALISSINNQEPAWDECVLLS